MFGGVSGHAGLFSDAYDLAVLSQTLLNGGTFDGISFFKKETIDYFSAYHSDISRRGYGFDKPEKDNAVRPDPYPCLSASPQTFGHKVLPVPVFGLILNIISRLYFYPIV